MPTCLFQSFDEAFDSKSSAARLAGLRAELQGRGLDGFVVPRADRHQGANVAAADQRLPWLTGFTGSAGTAIAGLSRAAIFVDGRYTLQAREQVLTDLFAPAELSEAAIAAWIADSLPRGGKLGFDPWLHTADGVAQLDKAAAAAGLRLVPTDGNPIDTIWTDRPAPPRAPVKPQPLEFAGEATAAKLARVRAALAKTGCAAEIVSDPTNLCWLFNIRGGDVAHVPIVHGFAIVPFDGMPTLFVDAAKITPEVEAGLDGLFRRAEPTSLIAEIRALAGAHARIRIDAITGAYALKHAVETAGGQADIGPDPISLIKAVKNPTEQDGARAAHRRDGVAIARFLAWFDGHAGAGALTEIDAVEALEDFRRQTNALADISFPSISGAGAHAALPHYRVSHDSNAPIGPGIFLIDSGGQYQDGTTDITRTLAVGSPSDEMRDRYTRVLKGHIAIATALFPRGTSGAQIDGFARQFLWAAGLDFDHGTGHGVGSFLSVHEGPHRIAKIGTAPLEPGMIVSNEPGYYKEGAYGIRIENLLLVEERQLPGAERPMLGFETLSFAPIDTTLIEPRLMTEVEIAWLDAYHARVRAMLAPALDPDTTAWLIAATEPLRR